MKALLISILAAAILGAAILGGFILLTTGAPSIAGMLHVPKDEKAKQELVYCLAEQKAKCFYGLKVCAKTADTADKALQCLFGFDHCVAATEHCHEAPTEPANEN